MDMRKPFQPNTIQLMKSEAKLQWIKILESAFAKKQELWKKNPSTSKKKMMQKVEADHFHHLLKNGLPSVKDSLWKFNPLQNLLNPLFQPVLSVPPISSSCESSKEDFDGSYLSFPETYQIHFHNGSLTSSSASLKLAPMEWSSWQQSSSNFPTDFLANHTAFQKKGDGFCHLAKALTTNGYILLVPKGHKVERPVHIHWSFDESAPPYSLWNMRNLIYLEKNAELTLIETADSKNSILLNQVTDIKTEKGSCLNSLNLEQTSFPLHHLKQSFYEMQKESQLNRFSLNVSSKGWSRDFVEINHLAEGTQSTLLGLSLLRNTHKADQRFFINHLKGNGYSRQFCRTILNDQAQHIFHGNIHVTRQATGVDCAQSAKNFSLSSHTQSYIQPELQIDCDEVKAQHGATMGHLDANEIFYLQSRGLSKKSAFEILIFAYIREVLDQFPEKNLTQHLVRQIGEKKGTFLHL